MPSRYVLKQSRSPYVGVHKVWSADEKEFRSVSAVGVAEQGLREG